VGAGLVTKIQSPHNPQAGDGLLQSIYFAFTSTCITH